MMMNLSCNQTAYIPTDDARQTRVLRDDEYHHSEAIPLTE